MRLTKIAVLPILGLMAQAAHAAPVTYACEMKLDQSSPEIAFSIPVDQIVLDVEARTLLLRVANTLGTSDPKELSLANHGGNTMQIKAGSIDGQEYTSGAGIDERGIAYAFYMTQEEFYFSNVSFAGPLHAVWECKQ